jgi:hypothetical protein
VTAAARALAIASRGCGRWWIVLIGAWIVAGSAGATSYRCDDAGHVTYGNQPCTSGRQTEVVGTGAAPNAEDRAAAIARQRADEATLARLARERRQDERAAALAARRGTDRGNSLRSCAKLQKDARQAHDDYDLADPRQQPKARVRMQRADEDYAALCKRKP